MKKRYLGKDKFAVSAIGLGCMGMIGAYGSVEESKAIDTIHTAIDLGVTFLDTAEMYGPYDNEILVGKAIRGMRDKVQIATKFGYRLQSGVQGFARVIGVDSRPEHIREVAEASLKRLNIETIDLFYQHRVDPAVPIEDVVGTMSELIKEGKIRHIGLSEVSSKNLRRANKVHPITAVQSEYSLWTRDVEADVLKTCRELGVGFVPYSPLGKGFLTGKISGPADMSEKDTRRNYPRFQEEALQKNQKLLDQLQEVAGKYHCSLAQMALAWLLSKGDDIVPIPGASKVEHLKDNIAAVALKIAKEDIEHIDNIFQPEKVIGLRYSPDNMKFIDK